VLAALVGKLYCRRARPTPPGPDRVVPLALPPARGTLPTLFGRLRQPSRSLVRAWQGLGPLSVVHPSALAGYVEREAAL